MALDLNDKTSNGNTLTNNNGATEVTTSLPTVTGNVSAADLAVASSQYFSASDSTSLSITGNMTIELWVKFTSLPASGLYMALVSKFKFTGSNDRSYLFFINNDTGQYSLGGNISADGTATDQVRQDISAPSTGTWYHYAITITPANAAATEFEFFVNGASVGNGNTIDSDSGATAIYDSIAQLNIGARDNGASRYLDAKVDEIRIWNTIRTGTQINNNKGVQLIGSESNLSAYYPLNVLTVAATSSLLLGSDI